MRTVARYWLAAGCALTLAVAVVALRSPGHSHDPSATPVAARVPALPDAPASPSGSPSMPLAVPPAVPASSPSSVPSDETTLMERLRSMVDSDPKQALDLAREGDRRFPGSSDSAERAMIEVKALAREGHYSEARGAAEAMVNKYPGTRWALEVERHTGAHPRINH